MDNRAAQLKALFIDTIKNADPELADKALLPEGEKVVDAVCDGIVKAFDILSQKPEA